MLTGRTIIVPVASSGIGAAVARLPARDGAKVMFGAQRGARLEALAQESRINALLPCGTMTEMAGSDPGFHEIVRNMHALKRMAAPEEIARAALFLLSEQAFFVTGSAMLADAPIRSSRCDPPPTQPERFPRAANRV